MGTLTHGYGKPYGYRHDLSTCRWCGDKLRQEKVIDPKSAEPYPANLITLPHGGYQGNGRFCSLRCGYQWAVRRMQGMGQ